MEKTEIQIRRINRYFENLLYDNIFSLLKIFQLNILQSTSMIYKTINEYNVNCYLAYPQNEHMVNIINFLLEGSFSDSCIKISKIKNDNDLSLCDIISEIHEIILSDLLNINASKTNITTLNTDQLMHILFDLKKIEQRLLFSMTDTIHTSALIAIFKKV